MEGIFSRVGITRCNPDGRTFPLKLVGTGYEINGANGTQPPADVVVTAVSTVGPYRDPAPVADMFVRAVETKPVAGDWSMTAVVLCATPGTP